MKIPTESLVELFQNLAHDPGSGRAIVTTTSFADHDQVDLSPSNPRAARMRAILSKNTRHGVTLVIGKGTIFEIPENGGRYSEQPSAIDEARVISKAVIGGRFSEKVRTNSQNRVVSSKGTVDIPPLMTARWRRLFVNPFQRTSVEFKHYEPY
jgi:hypothetical protein